MSFASSWTRIRVTTMQSTCAVNNSSVRFGLILGNFEMREEYFMNYDFLRKHGDKIDQFGRNFRMLDFEDGGMYFGVVENELPSGLGAFVYSDLKFHCGIYANGLMNGLSRIHFGNGDVYDGEADDGQMHGRGYFFDCENNDWVFGEFEGDNCTKVLESGEGFPRDNILKFRAMLHNAYPQGNTTINKVTESLSLDLDILFEYAGKDIKLVPPEPDRSSANQSNDSHVRTENSQISQKTGNRRKEMDEFYKKTLASRELNKQPSKNPGTVNYTSNSQSYSKRDSSQASNMNSGNAQSSEALPIAGPPAPQPKPKQPATATGQFQSNGSSANHNSVTNLNSGRSPNSQQSKKSTPGNQIVRDVHVVKPKAFQGYSSVGTGARSPDASQAVSQQVSPNRDTLVAPHAYERGTRGRSPAEQFQPEAEEEEAEDEEDEDELSAPHLRDMSIQTEDQVRVNPTYPAPVDTRPMQIMQDNSETQLSYLKNIQTMVDELRQLVSDKMSVQSVSLGGGGASGGLMSPFATVLSGVHHKTSSQGVQVDMPSETRELIEKLDVLRGNLGLHQDSDRGLFAMPETDSNKGNLGMLVQFETLGKPREGESKGSPGFAPQEGGNDKVRLDWQGDIESQLIELRAKQLEEAMAQRFGAVPAPSDDSPLFNLVGEDLMEVDENNIGEELEPIKESVDEDDEGEVFKPAPDQEQLVAQVKEQQGEGSRAPRSAIRDNQSSEPSHTLSPFTEEKIKELHDDSPWNPHQNSESNAQQQSAQSQKLLIQPLQNLVIDSRVSNFMDSKRGQDSQAGSFIPFESSTNKRNGDHPEFGSLIEGQLDHHLARKYSAPRNAEGRRSSQRDRSQSSNRSSRNVSSERSVTMRVPYWYFLNPYMYAVSEEVDFSDGVAPVSEQSLRATKYHGQQSTSNHKEGDKSSPNPRSLKIEEITLSLVSPGSENGLQAAADPQVREFIPDMRVPGVPDQWMFKNQSSTQEKRVLMNQSYGNPLARPLPQPKPPLWPNTSSLSQPVQHYQKPFATGTSQLVLPTQQHLPATGLLPGVQYAQQLAQVPARPAS